MIKTIYDIPEKIDLRDGKVQEELKAISVDWIERGEGQQRLEHMQELWLENAHYYEGYDAPVGFETKPLQAFAENNQFINTKKFRLRKDEETGKVFVINNKVKDAIDGQIGDYTNVKKVIKVENDDISGNDNIEFVIQKSLESIQDRKQVWEQVFTPCISGLAKYGLYWWAIIYNPRINPPFGDIRFECYHPRDVLIDPQARQKYFLDARWVIRKIKVPIEEALEYIRRYKPDATPESVTADSDYYSLGNQYHINMHGNDDLFMTFYVIEYKKQGMQKRAFGAEGSSPAETSRVDDPEGTPGLRRNDKGQGDSAAGITKQELRNEGGRAGIELEEEVTRYYKMIYNSSLGVIHHSESRYANITQGDQWQFEIIPFYNQENSLRQYPNSDIEKLANIQDLINISETLILDNARQANMIRYIVQQALHDEYGDLFEDFMKTGGILPVKSEDVQKDITQFKWQELPNSFKDFYAIIKENFSEHGSQNAILQGAYPKGADVSKPIIDGLQQMRARHYGYKETNITWAITQGAKLIYRIIAREWREENFIKVTKRDKSDPKYIPINSILTLAEYEELLGRVYPNTDIETASMKFDDKNEVAFILPKQLSSGWFVNQSGRLITDISEVKEGESLVLINMLSIGGYDKIDIQVTMDWDYEKNKLENAVKAMEFSDKGKISDETLFENSGDYWDTNKDEIMEKNRAQRKLEQMALEIEERGPEFQQAVEALKQQFDMTGKGKGKPQPANVNAQ